MDIHRQPGCDSSDASPRLEVGRRDFLKVTGGVIVFLTLGELPAEGQGRRRRGLPDDFNAFLRIGEDGRVTCLTGKIEMGQGIITSLAQMLADELDVPLGSVEMVMGDTDLCPWDGGTYGSLTTRFFGPPLRAAAAEARQVLLDLASERLGIPVDQLAVENGVVFGSANRKNRVAYGDLAKGKRIERRLEAKAAVKAPSAFRVMGRPVLRRDALEKVTGQAKYAADIQFPDMLYARILRPPAHDARLLDVDTSGVQSVAGAQVVRDGDLVAVLHSYPDQAEKALSRMKAGYSTPESTVDDRNIFDHLLSVAPEGNVASQGGAIQDGEALAATVVEETYLDGYVAHAPIEPHAAVVRIEGGKATVWASTQTPFRAKEDVAEALGFPSEKVRVITPFVGGGFGGKTSNLQVVEAARLAKLAGKPVQVAWTRAEEFFYDTFRPAAVVKIRSGVTDEGQISFWDYRVYFAGSRGSEHFYDIPHHRTTVHGSNWRGAPGSHPFVTGAWRAPSNNTNSFARESQIDMMAAKAGMDALAFRLKHLKDAKMRGVLLAAAEKFGWPAATSPSGRGYGIACGIDAGTSVATMAEVEVDRERGDVRVKRVVCAQDMGLVINPQGAKIQMEGCITMGMGYALTEDIHFRGGEVLDRNFDTYEIPRFSWLPEIETLFVEDKNAPPQGGGEPALITMGAVIANAIYDAVGVRMRQLPMTPERIMAAMAK